MNGNNLLVRQCFGFVSGMAKRIMRAVEFEPYVIFSCADPNPCWTSAAIIHQALVNLDPFTSYLVVIFGALLLPEENIRLLL